MKQFSIWNTKFQNTDTSDTGKTIIAAKNELSWNTGLTTVIRRRFGPVLTGLTENAELDTDRRSLCDAHKMGAKQ